MSHTSIARALTLASTFGLLLLIPAWALWLSPRASQEPEALVLTAALMLPLLLPLRGLLRGSPYSYAWAAFIALLYFIHGVVELWAVSGSRGPALAETLLASVLFVASMMYTRWRARELKAAQAADA